MCFKLIDVLLFSRQRNNSDYYDGVFNVYTGVDDIDKFGTMEMWNYSRHNGQVAKRVSMSRFGVAINKYRYIILLRPLFCSFYEAECGMVNGSFGEGWSPRRNRSTISMYITDICR